MALRVREAAAPPFHIQGQRVVRRRLEKGAKSIKEIIRQGVEVPEGQNDLRRMQLRELALLNGTLRENDLLGGPRCSNCGAPGHKAWQCPDRPNITNNVICACCGGTGHIARDCRERGKGGGGGGGGYGRGGGFGGDGGGGGGGPHVSVENREALKEVDLAKSLHGRLGVVGTMPSSSPSPSPGSSPPEDSDCAGQSRLLSPLPTPDTPKEDELTAIEHKMEMLRRDECSGEPLGLGDSRDSGELKGYRLLEVSCAKTLVGALLCPECAGSCLELKESGKEVASAPHSSNIGDTRQNELSARIGLAALFPEVSIKSARRSYEGRQQSDAERGAPTAPFTPLQSHWLACVDQATIRRTRSAIRWPVVETDAQRQFQRPAVSAS
ncbi:hypothetical protein HPB47_008922 [Ixodes persulcatus]|uniref:Uncharacterized protein n=1 Tax=Ixodes persulcatus TaxID=34615 RepID=A0AC60P3C6_IXOPE|nr:hypothetical protein HPB47_008922 [Ixodes persulcatus]